MHNSNASLIQELYPAVIYHFTSPFLHLPLQNLRLGDLIQTQNCEILKSGRNIYSVKPTEQDSHFCMNNSQ